MNPALTDFEAEVLHYLLAGEDAVLAALRGQLQTAAIASREQTGVGFFINFSLPPTAVPLHTHLPAKPNFCFGDVHAEIHSVEHGAGFLLWVEDGLLDSLEGYTYADPWPQEVSAFKLNYVANGPDRDWSYLRKQWG